MKLIYHIAGMHCQSCVEKIKSALQNHVQVISVTFNPSQLIIEALTPPDINQLNRYLAAAGDYTLQMNNNVVLPEEKKQDFWTYYPIYLITLYIVGVAFINNFHADYFNWNGWMNQFMAGFFLVFSAFKFLDLAGFAEGYATYDLLAKRLPSYGYVYPFLELGLGILYLGDWYPNATQWLTIIIMGFSSLGVMNSLLKKQQFQCACLGTLLKVPLSSITLIEDLTMVVLAAIGLWMK